MSALIFFRDGWKNTVRSVGPKISYNLQSGSTRSWMESTDDFLFFWFNFEEEGRRLRGEDGDRQDQ